MACGQAGDYENATGAGAQFSRVKTLLRQLAEQHFDLCLIDTAAGLFGTAADVITSCDAVMIPQQAEPLGIRSVPKLLDGLNRLRILNPRLNIMGVCLTMVQKDLIDSVEAAAALRRLLPEEMVFQAEVPRDNLFVRASARGLPVGAMQHSGNIHHVFDLMRAEILEKLPISNH